MVDRTSSTLNRFACNSTTGSTRTNRSALMANTDNTFPFCCSNNSKKIAGGKGYVMPALLRNSRNAVRGAVVAKESIRSNNSGGNGRSCRSSNNNQGVGTAGYSRSAVGLTITFQLSILRIKKIHFALKNTGANLNTGGRFFCVCLILRKAPELNAIPP